MARRWWAVLALLALLRCGDAADPPTHYSPGEAKLLADAQALLDRYDVPKGEAASTDYLATLGSTPEVQEAKSVELGESMVLSAGSSNSSNGTEGEVNPHVLPGVPGVGLIPMSTMKSRGECQLDRVDGKSAPTAQYHSLVPLVNVFLQMKDKEATKDYLGLDGNRPDGLNYLWRKQFSNVKCEMRAAISMSVCWGKFPGGKRFPTTQGALGTVGLGAHHLADCSPIVKMNWTTQLWHNVSALRVNEVATANTAYIPPDTPKPKIENFDKDLVTCKVWYLNIEAPLEQLLSKIRHMQTLCALDPTMIDRDQECWRVVNTANGGTNGTNTSFTTGAPAPLDNLDQGNTLDSAELAAEDSLTELGKEESQEELDYEDKAMAEAMLRSEMDKVSDLQASV